MTAALGSARLQGRVCVITGTASGVGRASARLFAAHGAVVIGVDVDADGNRRTADSIAEAGASPGTRFFDGDVRDDDLLAEIVDYCSGEFGKLDVLFNNAVMVVEDNVETITAADWQRVMDVDVTAPLRYTQAFTPLLAASTAGSIINHSSIDGVYGNPHLASYSVAKAALGGLTRVSAFTLAAQGIRTNAIASGNATRTADVDRQSVTEVAERLMASDRGVSWERLLAQLTWNTPGERVGAVEELAAVALFFASDDSVFVNGVTMLADGGRGSITPGSGNIPPA